MHLLSGEELRPIQAGEQQSPSAVFYSATVVGIEALGEGIQQLLQPIVSQSVQYNQQHNLTLVVLHSHTFSMSKRRRTCWKGVPVIYSDMYNNESIFPHSFHIYTEALYCSRIRCLGVNVPCVTVKLIV